MPREFPAWQTVDGDDRLWVRLDIWEQINPALVAQVRVNEGRKVEVEMMSATGQGPRLSSRTKTLDGRTDLDLARACSNSDS